MRCSETSLRLFLFLVGHGSDCWYSPLSLASLPLYLLLFPTGKPSRKLAFSGCFNLCFRQSNLMWTKQHCCKPVIVWHLIAGQP